VIGKVCGSEEGSIDRKFNLNKIKKLFILSCSEVVKIRGLRSTYFGGSPEEVRTEGFNPDDLFQDYIPFFTTIPHFTPQHSTAKDRSF
jgi:hypothetical protein